ncbi:Uncharacterised protein [Bordetella pertussis]|nr:Uncharacterised protein [Bordetella pertussis]
MACWRRIDAAGVAGAGPRTGSDSCGKGACPRGDRHPRGYAATASVSVACVAAT